MRAHRLVEVKKGEYVIEKQSVGKDSLGQDSSFWLTGDMVKDDVSRYQSPVSPESVIWLIRQIDALKR